MSLETNTIAANMATVAGGGLYVESCSNVSVMCNSVLENFAHDGGGVSFTDCPGVSLVMNVISNNVATNGAGIRVVGGDVEFGTNAFFGNAAVGSGGALLLLQLQGADVTGNTIVSNSAFLGGGVGLMECYSIDPALISGNTLTGNRAHMGGGFLIGNATNLQVRGNQVRQNRANFGGGLFVADTGELEMSDNRVSSNAAVIGAGMRLYQCAGEVGTNEFLYNTATNDAGGISLSACSNVVLVSNAIRGNSAGARGGGLHVSSSYLGNVQGIPVSNEVVAVGTGLDRTFSGSMAAPSVVRASVSITDGSEHFTDLDGDGVLAGSFGGVGTVNYDTSFFSVTFTLQPSAGQNITANYSRRDTSWCLGNTIADNQAGRGGGVFMESASNMWMTGCAIISNSAVAGSGLMLTGVVGNVVLGSLSNAVSMIAGNTGGSQLHNGSAFQGSFSVDGPGNVDARNVWWGGTDWVAISNAIYDYSDDATRGLVFTDPVVQPVFLSLASHGWGYVSREPDLPFYPPFQSVRLAAWPSNGWYFSAWSNDLVGTVSPGTIVLSRNMSVDAWFSPYLAAHGTPVWWLLSYGLGTNDSETLGDVDGDGSLTWQEYYAGTVPTNRASVLELTGLTAFSDIFWKLSWSSSSGRVYTVSGSTNLLAPAWTPLQTGLQASPPLNVVTVMTPSVKSFFRVELE